MKSYLLLLFTICTFLLYSSAELDDNLTYVWPLPAKFSSGNNTLSVDPELSLVFDGKGGDSSIIKDGFGRYKKIIFKHSTKSSSVNKRLVFDIGVLKIVVLSDNEELQLGVDESYLLLVEREMGSLLSGKRILRQILVYGALRGLESPPGHILGQNRDFAYRGTFAWGTGYPDLWPSPSCREPRDVSNNYYF
ncbi:hypothetical protein NC653_026137 [Populus alba x Populus x berolinensis]|uniref:Beta-hexosaminidase eukaryotic type N-terminal domain-containing protein n=1 Tax=Populus alba x Populus x berolinensis TaxID=444605 RepID=A0AAD6Q8V6_9ROSI|nr:hypothetical protein NC653_026137 [Populus alba x Populus x berolinensis]